MLASHVIKDYSFRDIIIEYLCYTESNSQILKEIGTQKAVIKILKMVGTQKATSTQETDNIFFSFELTNHSDHYLGRHFNMIRKLPLRFAFELVPQA